MSNIKPMKNYVIQIRATTAGCHIVVQDKSGKLVYRAMQQLNKMDDIRMTDVSGTEVARIRRDSNYVPSNYRIFNPRYARTAFLHYKYNLGFEVHLKDGATTYSFEYDLSRMECKVKRDRDDAIVAHLSRNRGPSSSYTLRTTEDVNIDTLCGASIALHFNANPTRSKDPATTWTSAVFSNYGIAVDQLQGNERLFDSVY